jgi:hypothetical protein
MKKTLLLLLITIFYNLSFGQSIAFMKMYQFGTQDLDYNYLNNAIIENLNKGGLTAKPFSNPQLFTQYNNNVLATLTADQIANLKMFSHDFIILHKSEKTNQSYSSISNVFYLNKGRVWQSEFYVFNVNTNQSTVVTLAISTFDCEDQFTLCMLEGCSNIAGFVKQVKDFVQGGSSSITTNEVVSANNTNTNSSSTEKTDSKTKKSIFSSSSNAEGKFKVVRVKERNFGNNSPVTIDVYDKSLSLKVGDNITITRTDEVKIPGERKSIKSETTIGKAKITEEFNKPLYTAKLIANAGFNMKDYKDGDENYSAVKGEENKTIIASPKIMVIPKKIDPSKYVNGEYLLTKEEKMLIAAIKNKFEDNKFTTYGFESSLKSVLENRQFNDNVQDDIKSKILESSGMDFFVEYENLDQNNTKCDKVFDFKIRNYSTGEDVASDVKSLNSCGSPEDYKSFASAILNAGAISKINTQFSSLLNNGRKVSVIFTIANSSQATFNKEYNGTKLKDHIENCLQGLAFNGNLDIEGVVNLRMETSVNIPIINENTGKSYTTNTFSEDIIGYLKKNANIECESSVSKQIVNIKIK